MIKCTLYDINLQREHQAQMYLHGVSLGSSAPQPPPSSVKVLITASLQASQGNNTEEIMRTGEIVILTADEYERLIGKKVVE